MERSHYTSLTPASDGQQLTVNLSPHYMMDSFPTWITLAYVKRGSALRCSADGLVVPSPYGYSVTTQSIYLRTLKGES